MMLRSLYHLWGISGALAAGRSNSGVALLVLAEGKDQLPWPAGSGLPNAAQDALGLSLCDCLTVCLLFIWTIRSFPAKLLPC